MYTIQPFEPTDVDFEAWVALQNTVWPDKLTTVEEFRHRESTRDPKYLVKRFLVTVESRVVAACLCCEPWWEFKPGKYYLSVMVHPDFRRRGIGSACYSHLLAQLEPHNPVTLEAETRENQTGALRFLSRRGFKQVMRLPIAHLDVASFDPAPFAAYPERMDRLGIRILPLTAVQAMDEDWKRKLWDLDWLLEQDVPTPDPPTRPTFEVFVKRTLGYPGFDPNARFIALDGQRWVGMSVLWLMQAEPDKLQTGTTGVVRDLRRKGIATAMKLRAIAFAKQHGAQIIETGNEENNPMYQLNLKLGFKPRPAWLIFHKTEEG